MCGMKRLVGAVAVIGMLALSGCVPEQVIPTLPPTPTDGPLFASEEEALAAATAAYEAYLKLSNEISSDGGEGPERISSVAAGPLLDASLSGFETFRENGWRSIGESELVSTVLQFADLDPQPSSGVAAIYACVDYSQVDVLNEAGKSVVSPDRPDLQPLEISFDLSPEFLLVPSDIQPWNSGSVCAG